MTIVDLLIYLLVGAALVWVLVTASRQRTSDSEGEGTLEVSHDTNNSKLPASHIATLMYLIALISFVLGIAALSGDNEVQGAVLIGGSVSFLAMGAGLQYLFDIRSLLMRAKDYDDA